MKSSCWSAGGMSTGAFQVFKTAFLKLMNLANA